MKKKTYIIITVIGTLSIGLGWIIYIFYYGELKTIRSEAAYYGQWEEFDGYSGLKIFPENIKKEQIKEYYFESQDILEAPRAQVYALIEYKKDDYDKEIERLKQLMIEYGNERKGVMYNEEYFPKPAYISEYNWMGCYEYAIHDEKNNRIAYIFYQNIEPDDLKIDKQYLPREENVENIIYSIYEKENGSFAF